MIRIMFVCHGNICRSTMAECIMKYLVNKKGLDDKFFIDSSATSREEIGNQIYPPARVMLIKHGIPVVKHYAKQITKQDYDNFDKIICMEYHQIRSICNITGPDIGNKIGRIMDFAGINLDVEDPWYTDNFDKVFEQLFLGCSSLLEKLK